MKKTLFLVFIPLAVVFQAVWSASSLTQQHKDDANMIIDYLTRGGGKGQAYACLANLTNYAGNRYAADSAHEAAVDFLVSQLTPIADKVWTEEVKDIPNWIRNKQNPGVVNVTAPIPKLLKFLAMGNSTATPRGGITAKAIVVKTFDELSNLPASKVKNNIVVFNQDWNDGSSYRYLEVGATQASRAGAAAVLIKSYTPTSLGNPHTAWEENYVNRPIPAATITTEDADELYQLYRKGNDITIHMELNCEYRGLVTRRQVVADITGSVYPNEFVLFGGHIDSVDVGAGAMDDGGGVAITWQTLATVRALGLKPMRTLRAVFWTGEEEGYIGSEAYYASHKNDGPSTSLVMESDTGTFKPLGFHYSGSRSAYKILNEVVDLLEPIDANLLLNDDEVPGDPEPFMRHDNVPGVELYTLGSENKYFWYHHTEDDQLTAIDPTNLDLCSTVFTVVNYVVANLDSMLPKS